LRERLERDGTQISKKNEIRPWLNKYWIIKDGADPAFVCAMEDVLEVYQRPYDPKRPVVAVDETVKQLIGEVRSPQPAAPGRTRRVDYEYVRNGTASIFMAFEPLAGKRHTVVGQHHTRKDWADLMKALVDEHYREAEKIVLVCDNLNTHDHSSLYAAFPPDEARRIRERLEIHHTPKHGSWLNVAECELSVLSRQCLNRRIDALDKLTAEVAAWNIRRDQTCVPMKWQFTTQDARTKLKRLYPSFQN
jgi:hypothetical protein